MSLNESDLKRLESAKSYSDLYEIAQEIMLRLEGEVCIVSGPISTGGLGSVEENLKRFSETIQRLANQNICVFDQLPFETPMQRIKKDRNIDSYDMSILEDFYLPLFKSGNIKKIYFLPDWETSIGATWEHEQAKLIGIEIEYMKF